jgi:hypothetical protein
MISSKNERIFNGDVNDLMQQIIFDASWTSSVQLLGMILDVPLCGDLICTAKVRRLAALV